MSNVGQSVGKTVAGAAEAERKLRRTRRRIVVGWVFLAIGLCIVALFALIQFTGDPTTAEKNVTGWIGATVLFGGPFLLLGVLLAGLGLRARRRIQRAVAAGDYSAFVPRKAAPAPASAPASQPTPITAARQPAPEPAPQPTPATAARRPAPEPSPQPPPEVVLYAFESEYWRAPDSQQGAAPPASAAEIQHAIRAEAKRPSAEVVIVPRAEWRPPSLAGVSEAELELLLPELLDSMIAWLQRHGLPRLDAQWLLNNFSAAVSPAGDRAFFVCPIQAQPTSRPAPAPAPVAAPQPAPAARVEPTPQPGAITKETLQAWKQSRNLEGLAGALTSEDPTLRDEAAWLLSQAAGRGDTAILQPLLAALARGGSFSATTSALETLGKIGDPRAVDAVAKYASASDPDLRYWAVWALAEIGGPQVQPMLAAARSDSEPEIRAVAEKALVRQAAAAAGPGFDRPQVTLYAFVAQARADYLAAFGPAPEPHPLDEALKEKVRGRAAEPGAEVVLVPPAEWNPPDLDSVFEEELAAKFEAILVAVEANLAFRGLGRSRESLVNSGLVMPDPRTGQILFVYRIARNS